MDAARGHADLSLSASIMELSHTRTHIVGSQQRGLLSISAAGIAWGAGGAAAALLFRTSSLGPAAVSFWRLAIAATVLAVAGLVRPDIASSTTPRRTAIGIGVGLAAYQCAYFGAVRQAGLALGTLITIGAGPVFVAAGARFALGERLGRRGTVTVVIALTGLVLLVGGKSSSGPHPLVGVGLALLSAIGYAAMTLFTRASGGGSTTATSFAAGVVCLLPLAMHEGIWPRTSSPAPVVGLLVFLGVVPTVLAYRWYFAGLATVPAVTAAIIVLLEPVSATLLAVLLLGEHLTAHVIIGSAVLLTAVSALAGRRPMP